MILTFKVQRRVLGHTVKQAAAVQATGEFLVSSALLGQAREGWSGETASGLSNLKGQGPGAGSLSVSHLLLPTSGLFLGFPPWRVFRQAPGLGAWRGNQSPSSPETACSRELM